MSEKDRSPDGILLVMEKPHTNESPLLRCSNLHVSFVQDEGVARAVRGVSFELSPGTTLGIVGESGCGKSVTVLSSMGLIQSPPGRVDQGEIIYRGRDLLKQPPSVMQSIRGKEIAMIFQDPMTSLNPVFTCGYQIRESILHHIGCDSAEADRRAVSMLDKVGIPDPGAMLGRYPHELSGGLRQRVMIAMALVCDPRLLIADEPTTALDVTVQARILDLLHFLQAQTGMGMILITHDLGIVCDIADEIIVMYAGSIAEQAPTKELFAHPLHPYTQALLETIPYADTRRESLSVIPGEVPNPLHIPAGCPFHPRCRHARPACREATPALTRHDTTHQVRCILYE